MSLSRLVVAEPVFMLMLSHDSLFTWKALVYDPQFVPLFDFLQAFLNILLLLTPRNPFLFDGIPLCSALLLINSLLGKLHWIVFHLGKEGWSLVEVVFEAQSMSCLCNKSCRKWNNDLFLHV
jgi:hypothetical protein